MKRAPLAVILGLVLLTFSVALQGMPQQTAAPAQVVLTPQEMEDFLLNAKIVSTRGAGGGVTNSRRATLSDGRLTHEAHIQDVDQARAVFEAPRAFEINFKDTYRYNIGGYRLARLLGLDNVPMSVERKIDGKLCAVTWWIDDVLMDEGARLKKKVKAPDQQRWAMQTHIMRVFDELIQNRDRNMGNLVWTTDWKMWMIDHTRAFRLGKELLKPDQLVRIERSLYTNLRGLTIESLTAAAGSSLTKQEIEAVLARRDIIIKLFDAKIAKSGEPSVLYTLPR